VSNRDSTDKKRIQKKHVDDDDSDNSSRSDDDDGDDDGDSKDQKKRENNKTTDDRNNSDDGDDDNDDDDNDDDDNDNDDDDDDNDEDDNDDDDDNNEDNVDEEMEDADNVHSETAPATTKSKSRYVTAAERKRLAGTRHSTRRRRLASKLRDTDAEDSDGDDDDSNTHDFDDDDNDDDDDDDDGQSHSYKASAAFKSRKRTSQRSRTSSTTGSNKRRRKVLTDGRAKPPQGPHGHRGPGRPPKDGSNPAQARRKHRNKHDAMNQMRTDGDDGVLHIHEISYRNNNGDIDSEDEDGEDSWYNTEADHKAAKAAEQTMLHHAPYLSYSWDDLHLGTHMGSVALNEYLRKLLRERTVQTGYAAKSSRVPQYTAQQCLAMIQSLRVSTVVPPPKSELHAVVQQQQRMTKNKFYHAGDGEEYMEVAVDMEDEVEVDSSEEDDLDEDEETYGKNNKDEEVVPYEPMQKKNTKNEKDGDNDNAGCVQEKKSQSDEDKERTFTDDNETEAKGGNSDPASARKRIKTVIQTHHFYGPKIPLRSMAELYEAMCEQDVDDGREARRQAQFMTSDACIDRLKSMNDRIHQLKLREQRILRTSQSVGLMSDLVASNTQVNELLGCIPKDDNDPN